MYPHVFVVGPTNTIVLVIHRYVEIFVTNMSKLEALSPPTGPRSKAGKNSGGIPHDHSPRPRSEFHSACKAQSSERLICDSPMPPRWNPP